MQLRDDDLKNEIGSENPIENDNQNLSSFVLPKNNNVNIDMNMGKDKNENGKCSC